MRVFFHVQNLDLTICGTHTQMCVTRKKKGALWEKEGGRWEGEPAEMERQTGAAYSDTHVCKRRIETCHFMNKGVQGISNPTNFAACKLHVTIN